ncbi:MAG: type II toxin-antitoxin system HicB family antitoxin [SAR324 cluster bacterium]
MLIDLECTISKPGRTYLAFCEKLGVSDQGKTESEARQNLKTSLTLYLKEFKNSGELRRLLMRQGIPFTILHAESAWPGVMGSPQFLPDIELKRKRGKSSSRTREIRRISVPTFHWARYTRGLATV